MFAVCAALRVHHNPDWSPSEPGTWSCSNSLHWVGYMQKWHFTSATQASWGHNRSDNTAVHRSTLCSTV